MSFEKMAEQLALAAIIVRTSCEWEYRPEPMRDHWVRGEGSVFFRCLENGIEIRMKPLAKCVPLGPGDVPLGSFVRVKGNALDNGEYPLTSCTNQA